MSGRPTMSSQELGDGGVVALRDLAPDVGLLPDLENRCAAVLLGGNGCRSFGHSSARLGRRGAWRRGCGR